MRPFKHERCVVAHIYQTGEILTLLYEVTQSVHTGPSSSHVLGPTVGVRERSASNVDSLVFRKDSKTGGFFTTSDPKLVAELKELPKGLIVSEPNTPATTGAPENVDIKGIDGAVGGTFFPNGVGSVGTPSLESAGQGSRNGSIPPPHPANPYSQQPGQSTTSSDIGLEGVPGNMFDWGTPLTGTKYYTINFPLTGGWDNWLQSLGGDSFSQLHNIQQGPP